MNPWYAVDVFSGCGGMSCGFARRPPFKVIAAVDAEQAKPCEGFGRLDCNVTYAANIGVEPIETDVAQLDPDKLFFTVAGRVRPRLRPRGLTVLIACAPCTDFSRAKPENHLGDSPKNALIAKCADFAQVFRPEFVVMENARELIRGNNAHHHASLVRRLRRLGYDVKSGVHMLTSYGLPQIRERAMIVASRDGEAKTLDDLWRGWKLRDGAATVRHAIGHLGVSAPTDDPMHQAPGFASDRSRCRIAAIPHDGGSWYDLARHPEADMLLTESMKARIAANDLGSHPDVYGRLAWDKPAVTIKRECAHVGNGRYSHPEHDRLLTVREMALLQGFPNDYKFMSKSMANRYRHIGDAVPPMISYQISALVSWMKTGRRPRPEDWILPGTSLRRNDVVPS
jgi:DNA (cytosine-5)-methyltransferase 1